MNHFLLICIGLVASIVIIDAKAVPDGQMSTGGADNQVADSPQMQMAVRIREGIKKMIEGSLKGSKDIMSGAMGGGAGGMMSGIGTIVGGALTGAGTIVGGVLRNGQ